MRALNYRILADGIFAIAMAGLAGCATAPMHPTGSIRHFAGQKFSTPPASRAARSSWIRQITTFTTSKVAAGLCGMGSLSVAKDLAGRVWPRSAASRNGRTGIPPATFSCATLNSERV